MNNNKYNINIIKTNPYDAQIPGTSENFVQSIFNSTENLDTLFIGGDGRYYNKKAGQTIIKMAAANGIKKVIIGIDFLTSTPAASAIIRARNLSGGILLTASHNPGGPNGDFGIKYNTSNGGPAPEYLTDKIASNTKIISEYKIADFGDVDITSVGITYLDNFEVLVIDPVADYENLMRSIFNFDAIDGLFAKGFKFLIDGMHGIAGIYATKLFSKYPTATLLNCVPKEDFGDGHPDPNLVYAHELVHAMGIKGNSSNYDMGAACDGDADRNMILGNSFFVTPSDSVALLAANAHAIPYFSNIVGVARSMPTSAALDQVAKAKGWGLYEVPTGWKFFGNLMDAKMISICGEESFGTGSDHIREKDGLWAVFSWLSILADKNKDFDSVKITIKDIVMDHWKTYGRNYYMRFDYENVETAAAASYFSHLRSLFLSCPFSRHCTADEFTYVDPVDKSISSNQGLRFLFEDGSRIVYRLSGTGSSGATVRVYLEKYQTFDCPESFLVMDTKDALSQLIDFAVTGTKLGEFLNRNEPTVIT